MKILLLHFLKFFTHLGNIYILCSLSYECWSPDPRFRAGERWGEMIGNNLSWFTLSVDLNNGQHLSSAGETFYNVLSLASHTSDENQAFKIPFPRRETGRSKTFVQLFKTNRETKQGESIPHRNQHFLFWDRGKKWRIHKTTYSLWKISVFVLFVFKEGTYMCMCACV